MKNFKQANIAAVFFLCSQSALGQPAINGATGRPIVNAIPIALFAANGPLRCEVQTLTTDAVADPPCGHDSPTGLHLPSAPEDIDSIPRSAWIGSDCVGRNVLPSYDFDFSDGRYAITFTGNRTRDNRFTIEETGSYTVESNELRMSCFDVIGNFPGGPDVVNDPDPNPNRNCETSVEQRVFFLADSTERGLPMFGEYVDLRHRSISSGLAIYSANNESQRFYCRSDSPLVQVSAAFLEDRRLDELSESGCDYSDAMANGGWGWNPQTGTSCPPLMAAGCDYSDAELNDGWGWNPQTLQSCPPL